MMRRGHCWMTQSCALLPCALLPYTLLLALWTAPLAAAGVLPEAADIDDLLQRFRWLVGKVTADRWFAATVLPQLHVLAWGNKRGI